MRQYAVWMLLLSSWKGKAVVDRSSVPHWFRGKDPDPEGSELSMLVQYLDYPRETGLSKTSGLTQAQPGQAHPPVKPHAG